mgnify:CR=1 FL=1|tara:strand:+ start:568 stop:1107 length:540 start_codon:yes stop_codon:yes gene_type:complete
MLRVQNIVDHRGINDTMKCELLKSKRVILPSKLIDGIEDNRYFIFKITSMNRYKMTYTTMAYEFSAPNGIIYMPETLMDELCLSSGNFVRIKFVRIKPGTFIKLRPHHSDFTKLVDPKGFLERGIIKYYPVINTGETIRIGDFNFDVISSLPEESILTVETDLSVDFLEPRDIVKKEIK